MLLPMLSRFDLLRRRHECIPNALAGHVMQVAGELVVRGVADEAVEDSRVGALVPVAFQVGVEEASDGQNEGEGVFEDGDEGESDDDAADHQTAEGEEEAGANVAAAEDAPRAPLEIGDSYGGRA